MKTALLVSLMAVSGIALAQSQVIMGPDGRNIGSATSSGNYTQFTDSMGRNTGYSFTDGLNTTYTGKDGRVTTPDRVVPGGAMPWEQPLTPNLPKKGPPQF